MLHVTLHNILVLPQLVIPDDALNISVKNMMEGLKKRGLYDGTRWVDWKDGLMSEKDISDFLNKLVDTVEEMLEERWELLSAETASTGDGISSRPAIEEFHGKRARRRWKYAAMDAPIVGDPAKHKPYLVCTDEEVAIVWSNVHVCGEDKAKLPEAQKALRQGRGVTETMFGSQYSRRFVLGCTFADDAISIQYTDRSGTYVSGLYQVHKDPEELVRIVIGLTLVEPQFLGYDTTLALSEGVGKVTIGNKEYKVLRNIFADSCIEGRGTMCFEVEHPEKEGTSCVMKDMWVDVERSESQKEANILQKLNDLGITNIPTLVANEVVQIDGRSDSTRNIRMALKDGCITGLGPGFAGVREGADGAQAEMDSENLTVLNALEKVADIVDPLRNHHRIVIEPFGKQFCKFRCLEEFLLAIKDIVSVIKQLYDNRYLHRDISFNNVILAERDKDPFQNEYKRLQGFLIDYDHALWLDREGSSASVKMPVTGTVPFMAIELLKNYYSTVTHDYHHDLESLFYVICWICTTYGGPNGKRRHERDIEGTNAYKWKAEDSSSSSLRNAAKLKYAFASDKLSFRSEIKQEFHKYFAPIFDCICRMRDCLFPKPMDADLYEMLPAILEALKERKDPEEIRKYRQLYFKLSHKDREPQMVFEELFDAIDEARKQLPEEHRLREIYPPDDGDDKPDEKEDHELNRENVTLTPCTETNFCEAKISTFHNALAAVSPGVIVEDGEEGECTIMSITANEKEQKASSAASSSASAVVSPSSGRKRKACEETRSLQSSNKRRAI